MSFLINPFAFLAAGGDYESIATVTVSGSTTSLIDFTSLGSYQHLQVRGIAKTQRGISGDALNLRFNNDTSSNYRSHYLAGEGAGVSAGTIATTFVDVAGATGDSGATDIYGAFLIDILDYSSTAKTTTVRMLTGRDLNGSGVIYLLSGLWTSTSAVTSISFAPQNTTYFKANTTLALYGIKAP